ncbi:hypothetical protein SUGI_0207790 [Cryptomeria japonica]|nr:hypothetical protein SUGI_0207790 [Cryptomeria japonica]
MAFQKVFWASVFFTFLHSLLFIVAVDVTNMTIDEYVNYINPPALHNYEDEFGDSILCVKYSDQISLNPEGHSKKSSDISYKGLNISVKRCPEGTISVREIKRQHVERAGSVARFVGQTDDGSAQEYACVNFAAGNATEVEAHINSWSPYVTSDAVYSRSAMWVASHDEQHILMVGWQTSGFKSSKGCYDQACPGFVVATGSPIQLGSPIRNISKVNGRPYSVHLKMTREGISSTLVWTLYSRNKLVGYWDTSVVPDLANFATTVGFGGEVRFHVKGYGFRHTNTDMGSGHFPPKDDSKKPDFKRVAHINRIQIKDLYGNRRDDMEFFMYNNENCYNVGHGIFREYYGNTVSFGGPGGDDPNCHNIPI